MEAHPILVIGAGGQLAQALARVGSIVNHPVLCRGRPDVDITDASALGRVLAALSPAAVVNAAAYTAVDKAEQDRAVAYAVNAEGPEHVARLCHDRQVPLVHVSTDYVFDGSSRTPYRETDPVRPLGVYGASKLAGEEAIRQTCPHHVILRTAWLYDREGHNFPRTMLRLGTERDELSIVDDQHGTPTSADDLAAAVATILGRLLAAARGDLWGTYHVTCRGETTWFGFADEIFRLAAASGQKVPRLKAITTAEFKSPAPRPLHSVLDNSKVQAAFGIVLPPWQESLARCFASCWPSASEGKVA